MNRYTLGCSNCIGALELEKEEAQTSTQAFAALAGAVTGLFIGQALAGTNKTLTGVLMVGGALGGFMAGRKLFQ